VSPCLRRIQGIGRQDDEGRLQGAIGPPGGSHDEMGTSGAEATEVEF
jgi:hypothetical protein